MADGDLSIKLAEAEKACETANANWTADPVNFGLKKVKLSSEVVVKEIEFKIKEAEVKALVAQSKGKMTRRSKRPRQRAMSLTRSAARHQRDSTNSSKPRPLPKAPSIFSAAALVN